MSEAERITGYRYGRVIIDEVDVLEPSFPSQVVCLTGAHLDILRNLMEYANEKTTFYSSTETTYYKVPTDENWDTILAVVADLEVRLMGNDNVIWGYDRVYAETLGEVKSGDGTFSASSTTVPSGELWIVEYIALRNDARATSFAQIWAVQGSITTFLAATNSPEQGVPLAFNGAVRLSEGMYIGMAMTSCIDGDTIAASLIGYKMNVPE